MANLDRETCQRLLGQWPVGRLATVTADGGAHVVPCCFAVDGRRLYTAVDGKPKSTTALRRLDNIRANPLVSLVVDHYADDWDELWWVRVDGRATVIEPGIGHQDPGSNERDRGLALLADKYRQYRREPPAGALISVEITGITGWAFDLDRLPKTGTTTGPKSSPGP